MDIEQVAQDSDRYQDVLALHRKNSTTLGFMPRGAFVDRAQKGLLLAAVSPDGATAGYIMYDLPNRHITIRHLCVDQAHRSMGVARQLVDELRRRHEDRLGIVAECRNDFPAHGLWEKLDFEPTHEGPGRSREGFPLTRWWMVFDHRTLFTTLQADHPTVRIALDTDVFIDLFDERTQAEESRGLLADWLNDRAELVITKAVVQEIHHHKDQQIRARQRANTLRVGRLDAPTAEWKQAAHRLLSGLGSPELNEHDRRDVEQVARAAAAHVDYFVSRDSDLVQTLRDLASDLFQLRIREPGNLLHELWEADAEPYAPSLLAHTQFYVDAPAAEYDHELITTFLNYGAGEKKRALSKKLRTLRAGPTRWEVQTIRSGDKAPAGLFARSRSGPVVEVALLRVAGPAASTIARQLAYQQRLHALRVGANLVRITDPDMSLPLSFGLTAESFVQSDSEWWACTVAKHLDRDVLADSLENLPAAPPTLGLTETVAALRSDTPPPSVVADMERRFSPMKLAGCPLPTYLVPIQPRWAEELFDTGLSEQKLFTRREGLGISREHVYYSGSNPGGIAAPARLLWYVSKVLGRPGTGAVRACSRLEEVVVNRPLTLYQRFSHLGIYESAQVVESANKRGQVMALRFADTELFDHPIDLGELKAICDRHGSGLMLQAPQRLSTPIFDELYDRGTHATS